MHLSRECLSPYLNIRVLTVCISIDGHVCWNSERRLSFIVCRPRKTNFFFRFPFAENKRKFAASVFRFKKQTEVAVSLSSVFPLYISLSIYNYIYIYVCCCFKQKTVAQAIFFNPFAVCSSCIRKFVVCPFVYAETNVSYPFAIGLNGLNGLADLRAFLRSTSAFP